MVCGGCDLARYCSREHQKADWPQHKVMCHFVKFEKDPRIAIAKLAASAMARADAGEYTSAIHKQRRVVKVLCDLLTVPALTAAQHKEFTRQLSIARENYGIFQRAAYRFEASANTLRECAEFSRENGMPDRHSEVLCSLARTYSAAGRYAKMKYTLSELNTLGKDTTGYIMSLDLQMYIVAEPDLSSVGESTEYCARMIELFEALLESIDNGTSIEHDSRSISRYLQMGIHTAQAAGNHKASQRFARRFLSKFDVLSAHLAAWGYEGPQPMSRWSCPMCWREECPVTMFERKMKAVYTNKPAEANTHACQAE